ncbi:MAG: hypothetical protein IT292_08090 [Deltaproteobacteria bacterium]|nr:hypothetical protein [Deltaproteobacteria bacterium]
MEIAELLKKTIELTKPYEIPYAIAGGLVASVYREEYQNTNDVEIVINPSNNGLQIATDILLALKLEVGVARKADLQGGPMVAINVKQQSLAW